MKTSYYKNEKGIVNGILTVEYRKGNVKILQFNPSTLAQWFPLNYSLDLKYNASKNKIYVCRKKVTDSVNPYVSNTGWTNMRNAPVIKDWKIEEIAKGNLYLTQLLDTYQSTFFREPGTYSSEDVQHDLQRVLDEIEVLLSKYYSDNELGSKLPKFYNYEGITLLYQLIKNPKLDPKKMPMEPKRYSEKFSQIEMSTEDKHFLETYQTMYNMFQECRKIARAYES